MTAALSRRRTDWFAILVLYAAGLAASMHFAKVAPVMAQVGADLHLGLVAAGFAVSLLGIVGVIFAIATGALVAAIGLGRGILIALFGGAVIAALGALAPGGTSFLVSRFFEGFSHLLIVVCAPALMAAHATPRDQPLALALWGCFFGLGFAITSAAAPAIVPDFGWRGLLLAHALVMALVGMLTAFALWRSGHRDQRQALPDPAALLRAHVDVYRSGAPLLLALTFGCYTILFLAVLTFLTRYQIEVQGWTEPQSGSFVALLSLVSLGFTLLAGVLVRLGVTLVAGMVASFAILAVTAFAVFAVPMPDMPFMIAGAVMMASFGLLPGFTFANVPAIAPTQALAALTFGAIAQFGNVGTFLGTPIFAAAYDVTGWTGGAAFVILFALVGIVIALILNRAMRPM